MADDAKASLWEELIASLNHGKRAIDSGAGSRKQTGRFTLGARERYFVAPVLAFLIIAAIVSNGLPNHSAGQSRETGLAESKPDGTPVSAVADPLDGSELEKLPAPDPLDGAPQVQVDTDAGAPEDIDQLPVVRSGRSRTTPDSSVAYDGDPETGWPAGKSESRWVWFDLGEAARIREVRWSTTGTGSLTVEVSEDRKKWHEIGEAPLVEGWSGFKMRDEAQFVRFTFSAEVSNDATLVEFAAYGVRAKNGAGGSPVDEPAKERRQRVGDRPERRTKGERRAQRANNNAPAAETDSTGDGGTSGVQISTKPGKTKCHGDKARCRASEGKTRVEEDCATEGTCVIDVRADGGAASCDASGGDKNETGQGEGKKPGRGGHCEATANGGTVTIGDINP